MTCFLVVVAVLLRFLVDLISFEAARIFVYSTQIIQIAQSSKDNEVVQPFSAALARFQGKVVDGSLRMLSQRVYALAQTQRFKVVFHPVVPL